MATHLGGIYFKISRISHLIINILVTKLECPGCWYSGWEGCQKEVGAGWVRNGLSLGKRWAAREDEKRQQGKEEDWGKKPWKKMGKLGGPFKSAFVFSNTSREHFSRAGLRYLVAGDWPASQTAAEGSGTLFRKKKKQNRLGRCRHSGLSTGVGLIQAVPCGQSHMPPFLYSLDKHFVEHLLYARSWAGITHRVLRLGPTLHKNS